MHTPRVEGLPSLPPSSPVPPVLTAVGSSSQTANQGSTVTFSVTLTNPGLPLANVVWTKDGVTLYNTSNMAVTSTTLQLSNIQPGDRGQYVVTATNKAGSSAVTFSLFEQCECVELWMRAHRDDLPVPSLIPLPPSLVTSPLPFFSFPPSSSSSFPYSSFPHLQLTLRSTCQSQCLVPSPF